MAISEQLKNLVDQMPNPDGRGMYTENIDKDAIEAAVAQIAQGGRANLEGLIEMLDEPGSPENVKPHYALHCVVNHALIAGDEAMRKDFCAVLAANLDGDLSNDNKAYLCQELQWADTGDGVPALAALLTNEALCDEAAMALVAIKKDAADAFRKALPRARGRCRLTIIHGLAELADADAAAIFREALADEDVEVRLAAGSGISKIADAGATDALLKAAEVDPGWERVRQTKHCLVLAENLADAGRKPDADKIYKHLAETRQDDETYIRQAAEKAI